MLDLVRDKTLHCFVALLVVSILSYVDIWCKLAYVNGMVVDNVYLHKSDTFKRQIRLVTRTHKIVDRQIV